MDTGGGKCSSLALDLEPPHAPRVSFHHEKHGSLKYAWLSGTTWLSVTVDNSAADVGFFTSLALDGAGRPRISDFNETNDDLRYAWLGGRHRVWLPLVVRRAAQGRFQAPCSRDTWQATPTPGRRLGLAAGNWLPGAPHAGQLSDPSSLPQFTPESIEPGRDALSSRFVGHKLGQ